MNLIRYLYNTSRVLFWITFFSIITLITLIKVYDTKYEKDHKESDNNIKKNLTTSLVAVLCIFMLSFVMFLFLRKQNNKRVYGINNFSKISDVLYGLAFGD
jgi:formate hydrogenlyase subunit 3/multisubunit Na+/H+ antiporter MnhD subunit